MLRTKRTFVLNTRHSTRASITRHTSFKGVKKKKSISSEFFTTAETIARFVGSIDDPTISSWNVGRSFDATIARDSNNNNNNYYYNYDKSNDHRTHALLRTGYVRTDEDRFRLSERTVPPSAEEPGVDLRHCDHRSGNRSSEKTAFDRGSSDSLTRVTSRIDGSLVSTNDARYLRLWNATDVIQNGSAYIRDSKTAREMSG